MDDGTVEAVRDRRATRTPSRVLGPEHEVVDDELRAPSEEISEGCCPLIGLQAVLLVDLDQGSSCRLRASSSLRLVNSFLASSNSSPRRQPSITCSRRV